MENTEEDDELTLVRVDTPPKNVSSTSSDKEFERSNVWKSCCLRVDKRAITFFSQFTISLIIIIFCLGQLYILDKCDSDIYMNLLTLILGTWLPNPSMK
jgi:hypothetical protein